MENRDKMHLDIERYLDGEMDDADKQAFETRLGSDTDLAIALESHKTARNAVLQAHRYKENQRDQIKDWFAEVKDEPGPKPIIQRLIPYLSIAAVLLSLIAIGNFQGWFDTAAPCNSLYTHGFTLPEPEVLLGSRGQQSPDQQWRAGLYFFLQNECSKARLAMENLMKDPDFSYMNEARLYVGACLLQENQSQNSEEALALLKAIPKDSPTYPEAQWYVAMGYSQLQDCEEVRNTLETIANTPGHYKQEAAKLALQKL